MGPRVGSFPAVQVLTSILKKIATRFKSLPQPHPPQPPPTRGLPPPINSPCRQGGAPRHPPLLHRRHPLRRQLRRHDRESGLACIWVWATARLREPVFALLRLLVRPSRAALPRAHPLRLSDDACLLCRRPPCACAAPCTWTPRPARRTPPRRWALGCLIRNVLNHRRWLPKVDPLTGKEDPAKKVGLAVCNT